MFDLADGIAAINRFRMEINGQIFTKEEIIIVFRNNNIPTNSTFWSIFCNSDIIKRISKNQYSFISDKPVYQVKLETAYNKYRTAISKYYTTRLNKLAKTEEPQRDMLESFAIEYLKAKGYKILAPHEVVYKQL